MAYMASSLKFPRKTLCELCIGDESALKLFGSSFAAEKSSFAALKKNFRSKNFALWYFFTTDLRFQWVFFLYCWQNLKFFFKDRLAKSVIFCCDWLRKSRFLSTTYCRFSLYISATEEWILRNFSAIYRPNLQNF